MESYKDTIISSFQQFNEERRLINLYSSINDKTKAQLQIETNQLLINSVISSRFHYTILTSKLFEFEESIFPFQGFQVASIQKRKQLLGKVDFYSYQDLIQYLFKNPTLFAQIIYFMLVSNDSIDLNDPEKNFKSITEDDKAYFCYYTFPSMFTFLLTKHDRSNALLFIQSLFKLHIYLHDFQFSRSHLFLNDIIFSYFLTTNPAYFFENSVIPLIPDLIVDLPQSSTAYIKTKEGHLIRRRYWMSIIKFVNDLFIRMTNGINLLPPETIELFLAIKSIDFGPFPYQYLLIIDSMFCSYLQKFIDIEHNNLMKDVCSVIYCYFPQDKLPIPLYNEIKPYIKETSIIDDFLNAIFNSKSANNDPNIVNDGLATGIQISKSSTYFTPRDFSIIHTAVKLFLKNCGNQPNNNFFNIAKSLESPPNPIDNQYIQIDLTDKFNVLAQIDTHLTDPINNFIDVLNLIDLSKFEFNTAEELKTIILTYGDCFLDISQRCQILSRQDFLIGDSDMLSKVKDMRSKVSENSDKLYQGLVFLSRENKMKITQNTNLATIICKRIVIPLLVERYRTDFQFGSNDILLVRATFVRLLKAISDHISPLNVKNEYQFLIKRCFLFTYIDQVDIAIEFQQKISSKQDSKPFTKYKEVNDNINKLNTLSEHIYELVNYAATLFQRIKTTQKISENIILMIRAMKVLKPFEDKYIKLAISLAMNCEVFGFSSFSKVYLIKEEVIKYIFNEEELELLTRFQENLDALKA